MQHGYRRCAHCSRYFLMKNLNRHIGRMHPDKEQLGPEALLPTVAEATQSKTDDEYVPSSESDESETDESASEASESEEEGPGAGGQSSVGDAPELPAFLGEFGVLASAESLAPRPRTPPVPAAKADPVMDALRALFR